MAVDRVPQGKGGEDAEESIADWVCALARKCRQNRVYCVRKP